MRTHLRSSPCSFTPRPLYTTTEFQQLPGARADPLPNALLDKLGASFFKKVLHKVLEPVIDSGILAIPDKTVQEVREVVSSYIHYSGKQQEPAKWKATHPHLFEP